MSNRQRPSLDKRHTRDTEKKRTDELDIGMTITVDGENYTVRQGDLTSMDTMSLRRETGLSFIGLISEFQRQPDIDLVAALVWLSRRVDGERMLSYSDVATEIGYDADIDFVDAAGPETDPEA